MALVDVDPDKTRQVLRDKRELRPVLSTFIVTLICGGAAEAESKTDDETEDCEEELIDADCT